MCQRIFQSKTLTRSLPWFTRNKNRARFFVCRWVFLLLLLRQPFSPSQEFLVKPTSLGFHVTAGSTKVFNNVTLLIKRSNIKMNIRYTEKSLLEIVRLWQNTFLFVYAKHIFSDWSSKFAVSAMKIFSSEFWSLCKMRWNENSIGLFSHSVWQNFTHVLQNFL